MKKRHVIVRTDGRFIGHMSAAEYVQLNDATRARTEVLAVCPSRAKARWIFKHLPNEWRRDCRPEYVDDESDDAGPTDAEPDVKVRFQ